MKGMVKWVKYMLLLHMFATYITFRPLPCASLRELHASFLSELRSQSWFLPLVSEDSLWLVAEAFGGAEAANATESSASSNSISIGAFVTLLGLVLALSGILVVCLCDCTCVQLCKGARRRLQALKHDVVSSHDVSRWPQGVAQMRAYALHIHCIHLHMHRHMHHNPPHMICRSPEEFAEMRAIYERKLQLATELGNLEGLPPLSAALAGTEHPALRRMPKTGAFVHLNEVTPPTYRALTVLTHSHLNLRTNEYYTYHADHADHAYHAFHAYHTPSSATRSRGGGGGACSALAATRACRGTSGRPRSARRRTSRA